jgi:pimeloyl-ACP methyl ester carboxylesterase
MTEGYVDIAGGRLWFERSGEGFPVVLLHPGLWDSRIWDPQFEAFAQGHDVLRYDRRGHGRSDPPTGPSSDLRDLRSLVAAQWIERCALVGCAAGAQLALDFALEHPSVVEAVVLVSPDVTGYTWRDTGLEALGEEVDSALRAGETERAMEIELAVWAPHSTRDPEGLARRVAMENLDVLTIDDELLEPARPAVERLGDVHAATMVVVGDRDLEEVYRIADLLTDRIPGTMRRTIADADQLVNVAKPERFNRLVLDFLSFRM